MKVLDPEKTEVVHNGDWILSLDLKGLLEVCSKFTVARILERDDFTKRYTSHTPIALHEFLYPVMQAYDSVIDRRPTWRWVAPTSSSTCSQGASSWRRWAWSPRWPSACPCWKAPTAFARCPSPTATTSA